MKSLLRFANISDLKKAIRNPKKALRVIEQSIKKGQTTAVSDPSEYDTPREDALEEVFDINPQSTQNLIQDVREGSAKKRIQECQSEIDNKPFSLGGAHLGGETAYILASSLQPSAILEIGVANGVSTMYILEAAENSKINPDIRAIDRPLFESDIINKRGKRGLQGVGGVIPDEKEAAWVAPKKQRLQFGYQYYVGDFNHILPGVVGSMEKLDLVVYDASKDYSEMTMAYDTIIESLASGGALISDDISVNNAFEEVTTKREGQSAAFGGIGVFRKNKS